MRLSTSKISKFLSCPASYRAEYILGIREESEAMVEGRRIHTLVEMYHLLGAVPARSQLSQRREIVDRYAAVVEQDDYIEIEHKFEQPIGSSVYTGIIDRWAKDGIYDLKTCSKSLGQSLIDPPLGKQGYGYFDSYGLQATAYLYHIWKLTGEILPFHFLIWRKDLKANGDVYPLKDMVTTRTKSDFELFEEFTAEVAEDILREEQFLCSCGDKQHKIFERERITA